MDLCKSVMFPRLSSWQNLNIEHCVNLSLKFLGTTDFSLLCVWGGFFVCLFLFFAAFSDLDLNLGTKQKLLSKVRTKQNLHQLYHKVYNPFGWN